MTDAERPVAIDLFCGLGGWTIGLQAAGFRCIGFDIERHDYPGELVLQDVATLDGAQLAKLNPALIVASPPCQAYSYRTMPWKRAKALPPPDNTVFEACFRIQRECSASLGRYVPMVVENVCGAQKWVGRAKWHYGSFYLWGDVPALMPSTAQIMKFNPDGTNHGQGSWFKIADSKNRGTGQKNETASVEGIKHRDADGYERNHPEAFGWNSPRTSSRSSARKAASARIAMIPFPLAEWIGRVYLP